MRKDWERRGLPIALEAVDCPFRELADPLLERLNAEPRVVLSSVPYRVR